MSQICNLFAAKWTAVLTFTNPLLNALCVEDMFFIAKKCGNEIVSVEVAPANWTLFPKTVLTLFSVLALLRVLSLLVLELCFVQRGENLWHWERHRQKSTKHALDE